MEPEVLEKSPHQDQAASQLEPAQEIQQVADTTTASKPLEQTNTVPMTSESLIPNHLSEQQNQKVTTPTYIQTIYYPIANPYETASTKAKQNQKKKKMWVIIPIVVLSLAIIGVGIFYFMTKVDTIELEDDVPLLVVGDSYRLDYEIVPNGREVEWKSGNESVAMVKNGKIYAEGSGECTITVEKYGVSESVDIEVRERIESVAMKDSSIEMEEEEKYKFACEITPKLLYDDLITWSSSNTAIATVNENGEVTAVKEGICVITATVDDVSCSCEIVVLKPMTNEEKMLLGRWSWGEYYYYYPNNTYYKISDTYYAYGDSIVFNRDYTWEMEFDGDLYNGTWAFTEIDNGEYFYILTGLDAMVVYDSFDKTWYIFAETTSENYITIYFEKNEAF